MHGVRNDIARGWQVAKDMRVWQKLFSVFCLDRVRQQVPCTPKKKKQKDDGSPAKEALSEQQLARLETPPRPDPPKEKPVQRDAAAEPIPFTKKARPESPKLMEPQKKKMRKLCEPEAPDMEEAFHQVMQGNATDPSTIAISEISEDMLVLTEEQKRKRAIHERRFKSRQKSSHEVQVKDLDAFLAVHELDYHAHRGFHVQQAKIKKAAVCSDGGWKKFRNKLLAEEPPTCVSCLKLMAEKKFSMQDVAQVLRDGIKPSQLQPSTDAQCNPSSGEAANGNEHPDAGASDEEPDEYLRFKKYVEKNAPEIELLEGDPDGHGVELRYLCKVCTTHKQPGGKINRLHSRRYTTLKSVLHQHLDCPSHKKRVKAAAAAGQTSVDKTEEALPCPGLCVAECTDCSLHNYMQEFEIWACHTKLDNQMWTEHTYWQEKSGKGWHVRSSACVKNYKPAESRSVRCCNECFSLGAPDRLQKMVVRFIKKYWGALLLQKRLFFPETEAKKLENEISGTTFALNNSEAWATLKGFSNAELQAVVRKSFTCQRDDCKSPVLANFISSVVEPCTSLHVGSVSSNLVCLSSQFMDALCANQQSDPWWERL